MRNLLSVAAMAVVASGGSLVLGGEKYFPAEGHDWQTISPEDAGYDKGRLNEAIDYAGSRRSSALVVVYDGRILAERCWPVAQRSDNSSARYHRMVVGTTAKGHVIEDVASVQKSVVSFLVGVAVGEGKLDIERPVSDYLDAGWSKATADQEQQITVRQLLSMTSGLNDALRYEAEAGTKWKYNTGAYSKVVGVLESVLGESIAKITRTRLTDRVGMNNSRWVKRPWAANIDAANKIGFATSARDLARFGLLVQAGGTWNGQDILRSPGFLKAALSPSQSLNESYGFLWWLNGQKSFRRARGTNVVKGSLVPTAPDRMVAARGALGRKLYVVPGGKLVVARLGDDPGQQFNREFWRRLTDAAVTPTR